LVLTPRAGDAVIPVDVHDLPTGSLGNLPQLAVLIGRGLIESRHPEIEDRPLHLPRPPFPMHKAYHGRVAKYSLLFVRRARLEKARFFKEPESRFFAGLFRTPLRFGQVL